MKVDLRRLARPILALAIACCLPSLAPAGTITMIVGNLGMQFNGTGLDSGNGTLHETNDPDGNNLDPGDAQQVSSTQIKLDDVTKELLMDPPDALYVDIAVENLGDSLTFDTLVSNAGGPGYIDWFTGSGEYLQLQVDSISYVAVDIPFSNNNIFNYFAEATVVSQNLPAGLAFKDTVSLSYSSSNAMFQNSGMGMLATGAMTISGEMVPEPSTFGLAGLALVTAFGFRRRMA